MLAGLRAGGWSGALSSPLLLPLILLATAAVFAPTLDIWFMFDDFWFLRASQNHPIGEFVVQAFDYRDPEPVPEFGFYRPLYLISFRLCYAAFGLNAVSYHVLALTLHLINVTLLWFIARRLLGSPFAANAASLIFALHPAYTETLARILRGNTLMVTCAYLAAFLLYLKWRDGGSRAYYVGSVLLMAAAVLYHTMATGLAAVIPAYEFLVHQKPSAAVRPRAWLPLLPFVLIAAIMLWIQTRPEVGLDRYYPVGWHQYSSYAQYLGLAAFPVLPQDWLDAELPRLTMLIRLHQLGALAMLGAALLVFDRRRWPFTGVFAAAWLFLTLTPNTTSLLAVPLIGAIPAQLYLPGASLAIFVVAVVTTMGEVLPDRILPLARRVLPVAVALAIAGAIVLGLNHQKHSEADGAQQHRFIEALRRQVPQVPEGSVLYVVHPPPGFLILDPNTTAMRAAIRIYYGDIDVRHIAPAEVPQVQATLGPRDRIFDYQAVR